MRQQILISGGLIFLSALLAGAQHLFDGPAVTNLFFTSLVLAASYLVFSILLGQVVVRRIQDQKTRYTARKVLSILSIVVILVASLRIWITDTSSLIVSYGIIGAALAFAVQDVFKNFVGGILIIVSGYFRVGDRISIGDHVGDVMDIGIMNTTMMEIRGWVKGDQPSGRLVVVPNAQVINHVFFNYTRDHSFVWDEIPIPLTYDSDWRKARGIILSILKHETDTMTGQAEAEIERIGEKYFLPRKVVEPSVYLSLTDNWILLEARYVADTRTRRILRSRLSELILAALEKEETITIASETMTVTTITGQYPQTL
ncbi:MAG: mechanosensitive channel MscS [Methanoregulaceae archaeon PtaB.Bin056]|nr:MAG: mechanosensitive channel MscS [Methanoregulaceae archaeon PtaB.Bin056]